MTALQAALKYADMGLSVIPIRPDKKPCLPWIEYQKRRATPDEIRAWFKRWPTAMVGIITGNISGLLVVDADSEDAWGKLQELLPDSFITCIAKTPRGYHLYLVLPKGEVRNAAGVRPGLDIRAEGGYVIAPPSVNGTGKAYRWMDGLSIFEQAPAEAPISLLNVFMHLERSGQRPQETTKTTETTDFYTKGRRDEDLFSVANALIKSGCQVPFTEQTLNILAKNCKPPFPEDEVSIKIESALARAERRERNITGEVREWALTTTGHFLTTDCLQETTMTTRSEKKAAIMALLRLCEGPEPILEKHGARRGCYRLIDRTVEFMDFANADTENTVDLWLPLDLHLKTRFYPRGVFVVAGVSGTGKTLWAFNTIAGNRGKFPIFYFNSEMGPEALKQKLSHFPLGIDEWARSMKVVDKWDFHNIPDKIQPDALNVIDYLEPDGETPYNIHGTISAIIRKLNKGVALICIQKKPGATMGTGGIYSIKAASLAVSLEWGKLEVIKNRFREGDPQPDRQKVEFTVERGFRIVPKGPWFR